jgi:hypothetical protein
MCPYIPGIAMSGTIEFVCYCFTATLAVFSYVFTLRY